MKKFKSKKKLQRRKIVLIYVFFFFFSYVFIYKYVSYHKFDKSVLRKDQNYINFDIAKIVSFKIKDIVNNPVNLLDKNIKNASIKNSSVIKTKVKTKQVFTSEEEKDKYDPIIYIYNTHQDEKYEGYSVYEAASLLNDKINTSELSSYFEEQSVTTFLHENNLKYSKSYTVSRKYLEDAISKYKNLKYYFDIHRDSVSKIKSTTTYNNTNYARVLFVIGSDNMNNKYNEENAIKLNNIIENKVPGISRGIVKHGGKEYNGIYNQDISENVFLIEVGATDNTKGEVENTINVLYESILEYIRGTYDKL